MAITDPQIALELYRMILNSGPNGGGVPQTISGTPPYAVRVRAVGPVTVPDGFRVGIVLEYNPNGPSAPSGWQALIPGGPLQLLGYEASPSAGTGPGHVSLLYQNAADPGGVATTARLRVIGSSALQSAGVPASQIGQA